MKQIIVNDILYKVYLDDIIDINGINLIHEIKNKNISKEAKIFFESNWKKTLEKDPRSFDGDIVELIRLEKLKDKINLIYDYTKYSYTVACKLDEYKKFLNNGEYCPNHISIPTVIKTMDNKILLGSSSKVNNVFKWKFPGGFWDKSAKTIFDNVNKEINEEIGDLNIKNQRILGIYGTEWSTGIIVLAEISFNSQELIDFIDKNKNNVKDSWELSKIKLLDLDVNSLTDFINDPNVKVGSIGNITLYRLKECLENKLI